MDTLLMAVDLEMALRALKGHLKGRPAVFSLSSPGFLQLPTRSASQTFPGHRSHG